MNKFFNKIINTSFILIFGIFMGFFSKWLDNTSLNDEIWWQHIFRVLDLKNVLSLLGIWILIAVCIAIYSSSPIRAGINVFLFFAGMNITYHLYTIYFAGFNPKSYMMIWYGITAVSPIAAYICWYAKREGKLGFFISSGIISVMLLCSFYIGLWYFDFKSILDTIFFVITVRVLYVSMKRTLCSIGAGIGIAYLLSMVLVF